VRRRANGCNNGKKETARLRGIGEVEVLRVEHLALVSVELQGGQHVQLLGAQHMNLVLRLLGTCKPRTQDNIRGE
jgi:hypothetical protein